MNSKISTRVSAFKVACLGFTCLTVVPLTPAAGQARPADSQTQSYDFAISGQPLSSALTAFSAVTGLQILYAQEGAATAASPGARGRMTADQALARLTTGTGYSFRYLRPGVVTLVASTEGNDGERLTGAVRVEGAAGSPYFGGAGVAAGVNGVNGSRDITATEGTGSFTSGALTIGSKVPQALKDVPQSISVLTNERLRQQNVTDFTTAMRQLPGVTLVQGTTSLDSRFYSRGFEVTTFQVDGGSPLVLGGGYFPQIDMSIYDHVELLRGAAGLFNGYGDPGGTVNLVRKKPLDHPQYVLDAQVGSWSNYRVAADATAPLALDGKLRGRLVMTYQDNHHFYKLAKDNKILIYGVAEMDLTPTTLLSAGVNYTRQDSLPWYGGLARYQTGGDLGLSRSTSFAFPWNRQNFDTTELFGSIEQRIGSEWALKLNLTRSRQKSTRKVGYSNGPVDPVSKTGPMLSASFDDYGSEQFAAEAVLTGAFDIFGQRQEVTIGANRTNSDTGGLITYASVITSSVAAPYQPYVGGPRYCFSLSKTNPCPAGTVPNAAPPINVFAFDPYNLIYSEPLNPLPSTRYKTLGSVRSGVYINLRLTAFDRLHLQTGLRWSRYQNKFFQEGLCRNTTGACLGKQIGDIRLTSNGTYVDDDFSWPPPVNLSFDITKQMTAYVGYTDIYQSQANLLTADRKPIDPLTGSNWEAGIKWAAYDGKLNLTVAAYHIRKKGWTRRDPLYPTSVPVDEAHSCCWVSEPNNTIKSRGVDLEATGEILPGWQISANYTYNDNRREGSSIGTAQGTPYTSIQPRNLYKLWTSYSFGAAGRRSALNGLTVSGGINGQSSGYYAGSGCKPEFVVPDTFSGGNVCATGGSFNYNYTVAPYAVLSGRLDYQVSKKWSLALNLENILDKTYYQTVGGDVYGGNWYGAPRSITATIRAKW